MHKICEFYKLFHEFLKLFPKDEKYSLGGKIEITALEILELSMKTVYAQKPEKTNFLREIDGKVNLLKILVRLAQEINVLDSKKYISLQERLQEIGKMVGGWMRYSS